MTTTLNAATAGAGGFIASSDNSGVLALQTSGTTAITVDTSQNVGIGTTSPTQKLDVSSSSTSGANIALTKSNSGTANQGGQVLYFNNIGPAATGRNDGVFIGTIYWQASQPSSGALQDAAQISCVAESQSGNNTASSLRFYTNTGNSSNTERMRIDSSGALILAGSTAQKATGTTWSNPSDQRLKDNIRDYDKGLAELMQVRVREWEYNGKGGTVDGTKGLGVVADEIMVVLPDTVENYEAKLNADDEEVTAIKKFDATEITWLLVKTVQEQQALITAQAKTINALTARIVALETV